MQRKITECSEKLNDVVAGETESGDWPTSAASASQRKREESLKTQTKIV
jgi:hypothetical protein